ncbi:long-chain N-acyl amino acid synthase [Rhodopirellula sp. SM50]|nr:long-chain N-acyl amino acid synthase [Rhodopirellula sp. SM50]PAY16628.1 long-chain N-acyl amino acid synthase [Rhodopirellula sp. SM50]
MHTTHVAAGTATVCPLIPSAPKAPTKRSIPGLRYEVAYRRDDLQDAFSLIYHSYRRAGLVEANESEVRLTPFHLLPTTEVFVTKLAEKVVSTVSLIGDGELGLPLESIYPKNVELIRNRGLRMGEIGSLADCRDSPVRFIETFAAMGRLLAQVAKTRGYDGLVAAAHPKHARLYQRILPFEQIGKMSTCPYANGNPAVMLALVFEDHRGSELYERFFGSMSSAADTVPRPWSAETYDYFHKLLHSNRLQSERPLSGQGAPMLSKRRSVHNSRIDPTENAPQRDA